MYFLPGGTGNSGRCRCELRCQGQTDKARSRSWSEELAPADQLEPASFGMRGRPPPPHTHTPDPDPPCSLFSSSSSLSWEFRDFQMSTQSHCKTTKQHSECLFLHQQPLSKRQPRFFVLLQINRTFPALQS